MKRIILITFAVVLISISSIFVYAKITSSLHEVPLGHAEETGILYYTIVIDECDYIVCSRPTGSGTVSISITHKGNCANPVHKK